MIGLSKIGTELDSQQRYFDIEEIERQIKNNIQVRKDKVSLAEDIIKKEVEIFYKNQLDGEARK